MIHEHLGVSRYLEGDRNLRDKWYNIIKIKY